MPLCMRTCLCACIVLNLNFMALPINNYNIRMHKCIFEASKSLMSARQPFVAGGFVLRVGVFECCIWRVWIVTEDTVRCKYAYARTLLHMPVSKRCISREIQKSIALAVFAGKRHLAYLRYVEN